MLISPSPANSTGSILLVFGKIIDLRQILDGTEIDLLTTGVFIDIIFYQNTTTQVILFSDVIYNL